MLSPLVQELALCLAEDHRTLEGTHVYSESNIAADGLSRLAEEDDEAHIPKVLKMLPRTAVTDQVWSVLGSSRKKRKADAVQRTPSPRRSRRRKR